MTRLGTAALLGAALLAPGCASVPEPDAAQVRASATAVLDPAATAAWGKGLARQLRRSLKAYSARADVHAQDVVLALDPDALFLPGSAQLRPAALRACAAIAAALVVQGGGVTHVVVASAADADLEPPIRLAARRATSLAAGLREAGVAEPRLRDEGRTPSDGEAVWLVVRPVVRGAEALAWVAPAALP